MMVVELPRSQCYCTLVGVRLRLSLISEVGFVFRKTEPFLAIKTWYVRATPFFEVPISSKNPPFQKLPYKEMFVFHRFPYVKLHYYSAEQKDVLCKYPEYSQAHR